VCKARAQYSVLDRGTTESAGIRQCRCARGVVTSRTVKCRPVGRRPVAGLTRCAGWTARLFDYASRCAVFKAWSCFSLEWVKVENVRALRLAEAEPRTSELFTVSERKIFGFVRIVVAETPVLRTGRNGSGPDRSAPFYTRGPTSEWWPRVAAFVVCVRNAWRGARAVRARIAWHSVRAMRARNLALFTLLYYNLSIRSALCTTRYIHYYKLVTHRHNFKGLAFFHAHRDHTWSNSELKGLSFLSRN